MNRFALITAFAFQILARSVLAVPSWIPARDLTTARAQFGSAVLADGRVVVFGGVNRTGFVRSIEVLDPATGVWTTLDAPTLGANSTSATVLPNGKVLLVLSESAVTQVFDPVSMTLADGPSMSSVRGLATVTSLASNGSVLIAGGQSGSQQLATADIYEWRTNTISATGAMTVSRNAAQATELDAGGVLVASGLAGSGEVATAELYSNGTWTTVAPPLTPRHYATMTVLADGRALLVGGRVPGSVTASSELYDRRSNTWTATGSLNAARQGHSATRLRDGRVLIAGGTDASGAARTTAELYDPATGTWTNASTVTNAGENGGAALLPSGRVLVVGGSSLSSGVVFYHNANLFDPGAAIWTNAGSLSAQRELHAATLLPNGDVLLVGGGVGAAEIFNGREWSVGVDTPDIADDATATLLQTGRVLVVSEAGAHVYDPETQGWSATEERVAIRRSHTATLLRSGEVLVTGMQRAAERYNPETNAWTATSENRNARSIASASLMNDGRVLLAGGFDVDVGSLTYAADIYDEDTDTWTPAASAGSRHSRGLIKTLPSGLVVLIGAGRATDIYDPVSNTWSASQDSIAAHDSGALTLLATGQLLLTGGGNASEIFDMTAQRWTVAGDEARAFHTATLLPGGRVLVAGGTDSETVIVDVGGAQAFHGPVPIRVEEIIQGCTQRLMVDEVWSADNGSSGNYNDSDNPYANVRLQSVADEHFVPLLQTTISSTAIDFTIGSDAAPGWHLLTVFAGARSSGQLVKVHGNVAAPSADALAFTTNTALPITLRGNDADANPLTFEIVTQPAHGSLSDFLNPVTYTPNPGFEGVDSFTYRVRDCGRVSEEATVTLTVTGPDADPQQPSAPDEAPGSPATDDDDDGGCSTTGAPISWMATALAAILCRRACGTTPSCSGARKRRTS